jgi:transcription elongation factor GreB
MSKAFTREDVDPPERSGRRRSASGLPPGAVNYITARGARRLQAELMNLRRAGDKAERIAEIERTLASVHIVDLPDALSNSVAFGATVTVEDNGKMETYTVVGVDELDFEPDAVSWISPIGKTLLAAELGDSVTLEDGRTVKIVKIEYR